jgi:farnesyl diphosphate synthase
MGQPDRIPLKNRNEVAASVAAWQQRFEEVLERKLPAAQLQPRLLHEAMRYSSLCGGKRIRPMLVYASGTALGADLEALDPIASAIELIHAYSLIHDDLPAMDDDDLRRGRPTCHLAFDEATAILAGDALQALAFRVLADDVKQPADVTVRLIGELAVACGSNGMAGGQMLDLQAVGRPLDISELERIHELKTGALICTAVVAPAWIARTSTAVASALRRFGEYVGLGFQIRDDILDVTGETANLGKSAHADEARDKPTFPALIGLDESQRRAAKLRDQALACLKDVPGDTAGLAWLADYMVSRDR